MIQIFKRGEDLRVRKFDSKRCHSNQFSGERKCEQNNHKIAVKLTEKLLDCQKLECVEKFSKFLFLFGNF